MYFENIFHLYHLQIIIVKINSLLLKVKEIRGKGFLIYFEQLHYYPISKICNLQKLKSGLQGEDEWN